MTPPTVVKTWGFLGRAAVWLAGRPSLVYVGLGAMAFPILDMLLGGQAALQYSSDVFDNELPSLTSIPADFRQFGFTLWDIHLTGGNALLSQFPIGPYTPDVLLSFVTTPFVAYFLTYFALVFLAGYGMHLFLRDSLELPLIACFAGGILATFSFWHYVLGFVVPLIPLHLWLTDRALADGRRRNWVGLALLGAFELYAGLLQLAALLAIMQIGYVIVAGWGSRMRVARNVILGVGAWAVSLALFAPVLFTELVYLPISQRNSWNLDYLYVNQPAEALKGAVEFFAAILVGVPVQSISGTGAIYGTFFLGAIALPFLLLGLFTRGRSAREKYLLTLLLALPIADYLLVIATPLQAQAGFIKSFQFVRIEHFLPFLLQVTAALGIASVARSGLRAAIGGRIKSLLFTMVLVGLVAEAGFAALRVVQSAAGNDTAHVLVLGWIYAAAALVLVAPWLGAVLLLKRGWRGIAPARVGAVLLVGFLVALAGERALYTHAERFLNGVGSYAAVDLEDPAQAYIAAQPNPGYQRTMTAGDDPNRMLLAGLSDIGGYQTGYPQSYQNLYGVLTEPYLATDPAKWEYFHYWGSRAYVFGPQVRWPIADLMGVRWIFARGMTFDDSRLTVRYTWADVTVYENSNTFPRVFITDTQRCYATEAEVLEAMSRAGDADLRAAAFVVSTSGCTGESAGPSAVSTASADITQYTPDQVTIEASSASASTLVLTDTYAPGWVASVNGRDVPITQVDGAFRGVSVPAGRSLVVFRYRPFFTYAGFGLAGSTALALLVYAIWPRRRRRRAAAAAAAA